MVNIADDGESIRARIQEIANEKNPVINDFNSLHAFELDVVGGNECVPRMVGELDYSYRHRLRVKLGMNG